MKVISKGAEATIYEDKIFSKEIIIKDRIVKKYRNPKLDCKIRKYRNKEEVKLLKKARELKVNTPYVFYTGKYKIIMEKIKNSKNHRKLIKKIGQEIAKLHNGDIIHGDLNLINIITNNNKIYFIDFGLGYISKKIEDKATDLLVFKKTLESSKKTEILWKNLIKGYMSQIKNKNIVNRIKIIENRGRYL